jgi:hypothetical protein
VSPPLPQQATRTIAELLERIERLERGKVAKDKFNVAALLDAAPVPELTFRKCAEQYIESHKAGWSNAKYAKQWPSSLEQYVYPVIGDLPVAQLSGRSGTQKIKAVLDPMRYTKTTTASRVRGRIEKVLYWAKAQDYRDGENPARWDGHLAAVYPTKETVAPVKHHAANPQQRFMIEWPPRLPAGEQIFGVLRHGRFATFPTSWVSCASKMASVPVLWSSRS